MGLHIYLWYFQNDVYQTASYCILCCWKSSQARKQRKLNMFPSTNHCRKLVVEISKQWTVKSDESSFYLLIADRYSKQARATSAIRSTATELLKTYFLTIWSCSINFRPISWWKMDISSKGIYILCYPLFSKWKECRQLTNNHKPSNRLSVQTYSCSKIRGLHCKTLAQFWRLQELADLGILILSAPGERNLSFCWETGTRIAFCWKLWQTDRNSDGRSCLIAFAECKREAIRLSHSN